MKNLLMGLVSFGLASSAIAAPSNYTSKEKAMITIGGGCLFGGVAGAYANSRNDSDNKSSSGTVGVSALVGCATGFAWSYFFQEDDQSSLITQAQKDRFEIDQLKSIVRQGKYDQSIVRQDDSSYLTVGETIPAGFDFNGLRDPDCLVREFSLGLGKDEPFVPVSKNVIIPRLTYYVLISKTNSNCVKAVPNQGYLDAEIPGLGKALLDRAEYEARKLKGTKK